MYHEENTQGITYNGNGAWANSYASMYHGGSVKATHQIKTGPPSSSTGWNHGAFKVELDGVSTTLDGYCCGPNGGTPQVVQYQASGLSRAEHELRITNLGNGPAGSVVEVDAFIVAPHSLGGRDSSLIAYTGRFTHLLLLAAFITLGIAIFRTCRRRISGCLASMTWQTPEVDDDDDDEGWLNIDLELALLEDHTEPPPEGGSSGGGDSHVTKSLALVSASKDIDAPPPYTG